MSAHEDAADHTRAHPHTAVAPPRAAVGFARSAVPLTRAGLLIVVAAVAPALTAMVVAISTGTDPTAAARLLVTAIVYAPVAAVALSFRRRDIAIVTGALAVTSGWLALTFVLDLNGAGSAPLGFALTTLAYASRVPEVAALALLPWLVARSPARPRRGGITIGLIAVAVSAVVSALAITTTIPPWLNVLPLVCGLLSFGVGAVAVASRWRDGTPRERTAAASFLTGAALLVVSYGRVIAPLPEPVAFLADGAFVLAQAFLPIGILAAVVVREGAVVSRRTVTVLAWAQALAFAVSTYLLVTAVARSVGLDATPTGAIAAAGLALVLGGSLRRVRYRLALLFADAVPDARSVLRRLGEQIADDVDADPPDAVDGVARIAASLRESLAASSVEIALTSSASPVRVGARAPESTSVDLVSGGHRIGAIIVTCAAGRDIDTAVRPVLAQTAGFVAAALLLATAGEEVTATRQRTLDVRREERRLLHGELHDRLTPALAGIGFGLAAAQTLLATGDPRATAVLGDLREGTAACTDDVRQLARTLLPTALDQGDLEGALHELAATAGRDGLRVDIDAHGTDVLDSDVQLGVYLIIAEAVARARRPAPGGAMTGGGDAPRPGAQPVIPRAASVAASVTVRDDGVRVTVRIDGRRAHVEAVLSGVRRRATEVGAVCARLPDGGIEAVVGR